MPTGRYEAVTILNSLVISAAGSFTVWICLIQDLQHPNEFIRGSTLRFLCKLKEAELLEPLMPAIRACLEHRHSYVRRNAVLAIYTIYRSVYSRISVCLQREMFIKMCCSTT